MARVRNAPGAAERWALTGLGALAFFGIWHGIAASGLVSAQALPDAGRRALHRLAPRVRAFRWATR
jgi:hypothetical protein